MNQVYAPPGSFSVRIYSVHLLDNKTRITRPKFNKNP